MENDTPDAASHDAAPAREPAPAPARPLRLPPPPGDAALARIASAVPDFMIAAVFMITWISPGALGERAVPYLMLVMLLEFIIVHASGFMGSVLFNEPLSRRTKVKSLLGLGAFYTLFAAGFSLAFRAWWPLWTILLLTVNRVLMVLSGDLPEGKERAFIRRGWAVAAVLYLAGVFATTLLPIPRFGLTAAVVRAQGLPGSGLWVNAPHRAIAFGFLYFLATGLSELFSHTWLEEKQTDAKRDEAEALSS